MAAQQPQRSVGPRSVGPRSVGRRRAIAVAVLVAILLVLPVAAWLLLPHVAGTLARSLLTEQGVRLETLRIERPGWSSLRIVHARARLANDPASGTAAVDVVIEARDVRLEWHLGRPWPDRSADRARAPGLLDGHLDALIVGTLGVEVDARVDAAAHGAPNDDAGDAPPALAEWLPGPLLRGVPIGRLRIESLRARVRLPDADYAAAGDVLLDDEGLRIDGTLDGGPLVRPLRLRARVGTGERVEIDVDGTEGDDVLAVRAALLPTIDGGVEARGSAHVDLARAGVLLGLPLPDVRGAVVGGLRRDDAGLHLEIVRGTRIDARIREAGVEATLTFAPDAPFALALTPDGLTSSGAASLAFTVDTPITSRGRVELSALAGTLASPAVDVRADGSAGLGSGAGATSGVWHVVTRAGLVADGLRLDPGTRVDLTSVILGAEGPRFERLDLALPEGLLWPTGAPTPKRLVLTIAPGVAHLAGRRLDLGGPPLRLVATTRTDIVDARLTLDRPGLTLSVAGRHEGAAGRTRIERALLTAALGRDDLVGRLVGPDWPLRRGTVIVEARPGTPILPLDAGAPSGEIDLRLEGAGGARAGIDLDGIDLDAQLVLEAGALRLDEAALDVATLEVPTGSEPARASGLRLRGTAELNWPDVDALLADPLAALAVGASDLTVDLRRLVVAGYSVDELSARIGAEGPLADPGALRADATLTAARLDVGLPVTDLACPLAWRTDAIELGDCGARLLGGRVGTPGGRLAPSTLDGYVPVAIQGLDLGRVLALMQDEALDGTGTLDGAVPVRISAGRPSITDGFVGARPPGGVLRYAAAPSLLAQPGLDLALRALTDFRYSTLAADVDYDEDGTLGLGVRLGGVNPRVESGRRIVFNVNVTQNLLTLLQSLRLSQNITENFQRRLEERLTPP